MLRSARIFRHLKTYSLQHKPLWAVSLMVLFHALFDGMTAYTVPFVLLEAGFSKAEMGLIYASSSGAGALFDILLSKFLKNTSFRRLYLLMFAISFVYPIALYGGTTLALFVLAMALWGLYYDLLSFGHYDFVGKNTPPAEHGSSFGVMDVFKAGGLLLAPLIAGFYIDTTLEYNLSTLAWIVLGLSFSFFIVLLLLKPQVHVKPIHTHTRGLLEEMQMWGKIGKVILPVLLGLTFLNIFDSFFWSIGPLLAEELSVLHPFGGLLLTLYFLPAFIVGWFVGNLTKKLGKKRTAYIAILTSSLILITLGFITNVLLVIIAVFTSAFTAAVAWPALRGAIADYISDAPDVETEIQGVGDFSGNAGYIVGPMMAGVLAQLFGNQQAFAILGIIGVCAAIVLIIITPRRIFVNRSLR